MRSTSQKGNCQAKRGDASGLALDVAIVSDELTIGGHKVLSYSAWRREAYAEGDEGFGLRIWALSAEQVEHLLERLPSKQLACETWFVDDKPIAAA